MKVYIKSKYCDEEVELLFGSYGNGSTAIRAMSLEGEPIFTATFALDEVPPFGCVFLKGWNENEGLPEALVKANIVKLTGRILAAGQYSDVVEAKLLVETD